MGIYGNISLWCFFDFDYHWFPFFSLKVGVLQFGGWSWFTNVYHVCLIFGQPLAKKTTGELTILSTQVMKCLPANPGYVYVNQKMREHQQKNGCRPRNYGGYRQKKHRSCPLSRMEASGLKRPVTSMPWRILHFLLCSYEKNWRAVDLRNFAGWFRRVYPICHGIQPQKYRDTETEMAFNASCFSVSRLGWVVQPQNQGIHNQVYRSYLQEWTP